MSTRIPIVDRRSETLAKPFLHFHDRSPRERLVSVSSVCAYSLPSPSPKDGCTKIWVCLAHISPGPFCSYFSVVQCLADSCRRSWRLPKFYLLWAVAFFAYAAAWMIAYFSLGRAAGEVVGSLFGSISMAFVLAAGFRSLRSIVKLSAVLFVSNFLGYFLGAALFDNLSAPTGMLLYGAVYGLFFGAGIGAALQLVQRTASHKEAKNHKTG